MCSAVATIGQAGVVCMPPAPLLMIVAAAFRIFKRDDKFVRADESKVSGGCGGGEGAVAGESVLDGKVVFIHKGGLSISMTFLWHARDSLQLSLCICWRKEEKVPV